MQVALKIWRYSRTTGDKELQEFEIDAPEEATARSPTARAAG